MAALAFRLTAVTLSPYCIQGMKSKWLEECRPDCLLQLLFSDKVLVLGKAELPPAPLREYWELSSGTEDSQWVQVRGVVQAAWMHKVGDEASYFSILTWVPETLPLGCTTFQFPIPPTWLTRR